MGAITLLSENKETARYYLCLFTCSTTRAIHLELARDMSASTFSHLLRRFIARRFCPQLFISDNGTNFRPTAKMIEDIVSEPAVKAFLQKRTIAWKFIPPKSPCQGGFYERLIGITKSSLQKALYKKVVNEDELHTIVAEIETRINNRPMTYMSNDSDSPEALTPAHLLYSRRQTMFPNSIGSPPEDPDYLDQGELYNKYCCVSRIINQWEKIWGREYVSSLREKFYGAQKPGQTITPGVGEVVLIVSDGSRSDWPLGRIVELLPDKTGVIRLARVMIRSKEVLKTMEKLIPLEVGPLGDNEERLPKRKTTLDDPSKADERPQKRKATVDNEVVQDYCPEEPPEETIPQLETNRPARATAQRAQDTRRELISQGLL